MRGSDLTSETGTVRQWTAKQDRDDLTLIPPLADEFTVYGGAETTERARQWALGQRYLLAGGVPACAHGLYLLACCPDLATCRNNFRQLDHADIWVPANLGEDFGRPFLLSHSYSYADAVDDETRTYGKAHGLVVASYPEFGDDWYGYGSLPIRMTVPQEYPIWPIEAKAAILLATQPVAWPEEDDS
jgi:hypothetical protein